MPFLYVASFDIADVWLYTVPSVLTFMQLLSLSIDYDAKTCCSSDLYFPLALVLANLDSMFMRMLSLLGMCFCFTSMKLSIMLQTIW